MSEKISVITPFFNGRKFVKRCYANLMLQTFSDWEWVVVDDGSTDGTSDAVRAINDPRIRFISCRLNRGRGFARSCALKAASGDWIVIWDMDDISFPDRLEKTHEARARGFDFICSPIVIIDGGLRIKGGRGFTRSEIDGKRIFSHVTLGCRRSLALEIGYDEKCRISEDVEIIHRLARNYEGWWLDDPLTAYYEEREISPNKAISSNLRKRRIARHMIKKGTLKLSTRKRFQYLIILFVKIMLLNLLRLVPMLYGKTLVFRSKGHIKKEWSVSSEKRRFLEQLQRDERFR